MSTTPSAPHLTTQLHHRPATTEGKDHFVRNLAITLGASAVVLAGFAAAQYLTTASTEPTAAPITAVQALEAYAPGGSVYAQQVPAAAALTGLEAFAPGGSVYAEQVPAAAAVTGLEAYVPGGSVYAQQVPAAAGSGLEAYEPGGSVYEQQVPAGAPFTLTPQAMRWMEPNAL